MRQNKPLDLERRDATRKKSDTAKFKTAKRKKDLRTSSWYETAASSIKAAPSQPRR